MRIPTAVLLLSLLAAPACLAVGDSPPADDSSVKWLTKYGAARKLGTQTERPVLLFLTTDGCSHCTRMKDTAFRDSMVLATMQRSFVPAMVKLSGESELARQLRVTIYPTTVIISPDGKILDYARGYLSPEQLRERMSLAVLNGTKVAAKH